MRVGESSDIHHHLLVDVERRHNLEWLELSIIFRRYVSKWRTLQ